VVVVVGSCGVVVIVIVVAVHEEEVEAVVIVHIAVVMVSILLSMTSLAIDWHVRSRYTIYRITFDHWTYQPFRD